MHSPKVLKTNVIARRAPLTLAQYLAALEVVECAGAYLSQDARYDDLTDECAAAKRALADAIYRANNA